MHIMQRFMSYAKQQNAEGFLESMIRCFAAPVLRNLKCATLLNLTRGGEDLRPAWYAVKRKLTVRYSLGFEEISSDRPGSLLLLIYKEAPLCLQLSGPENAAFLTAFGYPAAQMGVSGQLATLKERFRSGISHEVGLFLGYPLEDVRGFIENEGRNAKIAGYWKVYGDPRSALAKFDAYRKAEIESAKELLGIAEVGEIAA